jgi:hypothetical protein
MIQNLWLRLALAAQLPPVEAVEKLDFLLGIWDLDGYKGRRDGLSEQAMPRYKRYDLNQTKMIPLSYAD